MRRGERRLAAMRRLLELRMGIEREYGRLTWMQAMVLRGMCLRSGVRGSGVVYVLGGEGMRVLREAGDRSLRSG